MILSTPTPDPVPHSNARPITYVAYDYTAPARTPGGKLIPGMKFKCHVPVSGRRTCVLLLNLAEIAARLQGLAPNVAAAELR